VLVRALSKAQGTQNRPLYIVVSRTGESQTSKSVLRRYKSDEELRDIFKVDRPSRTAGELYVFRVVDEPDEDTWFLISFDISYVYGRKTQQKRRATVEYSVIKKTMYARACGKIYSSTYICPEDASDVPRIIVYTDPEAVRVESWPVKPLDDKTRLWMKSAVLGAIEYWKTEATVFVTLAERKLRGQGMRRAKKLLDVLQLMLSAPWRPKAEKLVGAETFAEIDALRKILENTLQKLEERKNLEKKQS